jgi:nitrogen fixation NifU-like protein
MYDEILLEHNLHPVYQGKIDKVEPVKLVNAGCGDELEVYLKIKDGKIEGGSFAGNGCAIALASADLFIEAVKGESLDEALKKREIFNRMVVGEASEKELKEFGNLRALECVSRMPARANCAKLAWCALDKYSKRS